MPSKRGTLWKVAMGADQLLMKIEDASVRSTNHIKGSLSGKIKINVYLLREVIRILARKADEDQDPGFYKNRVGVLEKDNAKLVTQNEAPRRNLRKAESAFKYMRAASPSLA